VTVNNHAGNNYHATHTLCKQKSCKHVLTEYFFKSEVYARYRSEFFKYRNLNKQAACLGYHRLVHNSNYIVVCHIL